MASLGDKRMVESSYSVIIPCRNGDKTIGKTLESLLAQTLQPNQIIVVDDASTDKTPEILQSFSNKIHIIRLNHNHPRNFNRVPKLVNMGLAKINTSHVMLSGDDSVYPEHYVDSLLEHFKENPKLKIASGNIYELHRPSDAPQGSGRIFECEWLKHHLPFPASCTWESGIMFKALKEGYEIKCFNDLTFNHKSQYGAYSIRTFGHAMYCLGYSSLFVLGRLIKTLMSGEIPRKYVPYELLGYVEYALACPEKVDPIKTYVQELHKPRIIHMAKKVMGFKLWIRLFWLAQAVKESWPIEKEIMRNRIQRKLNLKSKPEFLSLALTWKCQSRCSTCGIWDAPHSDEEMSLEDYKRLLRDPLLSELKVWEMTGGEPMLYKDIFGLTKLAFKYIPHAEIRIGTNCIAVNHTIKLLDTFKDKPLYLSVSIDGIGEIHDKIRGVKGNFANVMKVINHIRKLQKEGSPIKFEQRSQAKASPE